jgi:tetratricopeptide (TPR) repeat protein
MGLFDFLKAKPTSRPSTDPPPWVVLTFQSGTKQKEVENLKAVGRKEEALKVANKFIVDIYDAFAKDQNDTTYLDILVRFACSVGETKLAQIALEKTVEAEMVKPQIDLTTVFYSLGFIYHLQCDYRKELNAYGKAADAVPPPNCKKAATKKKKAQAHTMACVCAERIGDSDAAGYHDKKRRELIPDLNWDSLPVVYKWMDAED